MALDKGFFDHFDDVHKVSRKAVRAYPADKLDHRPVDAMMSAKDLIFHMLSQERVMLKGCKTGKLVVDDFNEVMSDLDALKTPEDLAAYGEKIHAETNDWVSKASEQDQDKVVDAFFGKIPAWMLLVAAEEHMIHHRGQFYVYLRMVGAEPPFVFGEA